MSATIFKLEELGIVNVEVFKMPGVVFKSAVTSATGGNGENYTNTQVAAIGAGTNSSFLTSWDYN